MFTGLYKLAVVPLSKTTSQTNLFFEELSVLALARCPSDSPAVTAALNLLFLAVIFPGSHSFRGPHLLPLLGPPLFYRAT